MRTLLLASALTLVTLAGCSKEGTDQGGVKVAVTTNGFSPGCVTVTAVDASGKSNTANLDTGLTLGGTKVVAIVGSSDWGPDLTVTAEAKEQSCSGTVVARASSKVTLPKTGVTNLALTLAAEDKDGDGFVSATPSSGLPGTDCDDSPTTGAQVHPGATEVCNGVDDNCDGQKDEGVTQTFYADTDNDGFGDPNVPSQRCTAGAGFVANNLDCDDTKANVHPKDGGETACDGVDDDCSGGPPDDTFHVGDACDAGCPGKVVCAGLTSTSCQITETVYADNDGDGHGSGAPLSICAGAGFSTNNDDCDDGDPFTFPGAPEICDQKDNSCAGAGIDATGCSGAAWKLSAVGSGISWMAVSDLGNGHVWLAGTGAASNVFLQSAPDAGFVNMGGACAALTPAEPKSYWNASWADPTTGDVYVAGDGNPGGGVLAHVQLDGGCSVVGLAANPLSGVAGLNLPDGGVDLFATSSGGEIVHNGGLPTVISGSPTLSDIHGMLSGANPVVVAVANNPAGGAKTTPAAFLYNPADGGWVDQGVQTLPGLATNAGLNGVWVLGPNAIFAVGNSGTFLRFDGKTWTQGPTPPGAKDLYSVVAFGPTDVYAVGFDQKVFRLGSDGGSWSALPNATAGQPLNDISGVAPDDLWVAGNGQVVLHWHEP